MSDANHYMNEEYDPSFQWTVFMYILMKVKTKQGIFEYTISTEDLNQKFIDWQLMLSAAEVNEKTEVNIRPFKLFDLDNFEGITVEP